MRRRHALQFRKHSGCQPLVDHIVRQHAEILWSPNRSGRVVETMKTEHLLIEIGRVLANLRLKHNGHIESVAHEQA